MIKIPPPNHLPSFCKFHSVLQNSALLSSVISTMWLNESVFISYCDRNMRRPFCTKDKLVQFFPLCASKKSTLFVVLTDLQVKKNSHLLLQRPEMVRYLSGWPCRQADARVAGTHWDSSATSSTSFHDKSSTAGKHRKNPVNWVELDFYPLKGAASCCQNKFKQCH